MHTRARIFLVLLGGLFACSSGATGGSTPFGTPGEEANSGAAATSGVSDGDAGSAGGATSGGSASGASSTDPGDSGPSSNVSGPSLDAGAAPSLLPDANLPDAASFGPPITLTMDAFTVPPNAEVYKCQQFGNPFGQDVDLVKMVGTMTSGSHHFFVFNMSPSTYRNTTAPLGDCPDKGLEFHPFPFLSQQPNWTVEYPAGMGYPLVTANGLTMNVHYLNASSQSVTPKVSIVIYPAKPGTVTTRVGSLFLNNSAISVPANTSEASPMTVTGTDVPIKDQAYTIFTNWSHMHQYAIDFQTSANGKAFYDEKQWAEPPLTTPGTGAHQSPLLPLSVKAGTQISWTCTYYNPTSAVMNFGDSAQTDDMCIYIGQYYPADGTPSTNPNYPDILYDTRQPN
jgi:hypothetical protein